MPHVTTETATVYRGPDRRFFTEWYAYRNAAKVALFKEHPCDCDHEDPEIVDGGQPCWLHGVEDLEERISELARKMRAEDCAEETAEEKP